MKARPLALTVVAGTLVFLVVLLLYLPASWFTSLLPPEVRCAQLGGSLWAGECLGLEAQGAKLGDATWDLSPWRAITGRLTGDIQIDGRRMPSAHEIRTTIDVDFSGTGTATVLSGHFPVDPSFHPQMPREQRGRVSFTLEDVRLEAGILKDIRGKGQLSLQDFRQVFPTHMPLGSYQLILDAPPQPDGSRVGVLRNLEGSPFNLDGKLTFTPPNQYLVEGFISGNTEQARQLVKQLSLGAPPDASGRNEIRFEGTF